MNNKIFFKTEISDANLKELRYELCVMTHALSNFCLLDRPPIKKRSRTNYEQLIEYKKLRVNYLLDNLQCNEPCFSLAHEDAKKIIFLEEYFNSRLGTIGNINEDLLTLKNYNLSCDNYMHKNKNADFYCGRLYEIDSIRMHEHIWDINELAHLFMQYALHDQFDIKYGTVRKKTIETKEKITKNPAYSLFFPCDAFCTNAQPNKWKNSIEIENQIKQLLLLGQAHPYILKIDRVFELKEALKAYDELIFKNESTQKKQHSYEKHFSAEHYWALGVIEDANKVIRQIRKCRSSENCGNFEVDEFLLCKLKAIASTNSMFYGIDNINTAKILVGEYENWKNSQNRVRK